jgi:BirA family biotin operon repressor/biotin-[acetyl-CoA-carboxylase] ligase
MSVLLRPGGLPLQAVTVAVALAAADACKTISGVEPGLKWPNDLVVDDSKLAGVLAEAVFPAGAQVGGAEPAGVEPAIVVGLGLNVGWSPPDEVDAYLPGATSLSRLVGPGSPKAALEVEVLLVAVLDRLAARLDDLTSVGGLTGQAEEHRLRCVTLGRSVRVEEPAESFTGTAVSISDEGHLVVETLSGRRTVTAGDVVHLRHQVGESGAELPDPADPPAMGLAKAP